MLSFELYHGTLNTASGLFAIVLHFWFLFHHMPYVIGHMLYAICYVQFIVFRIPYDSFFATED